MAHWYWLATTPGRNHELDVMSETNKLTGLYQPGFEKDSCGFGLIANIDDKPSHWLVKTSIEALARLTHRGAVAADGKSGDGCGLLLKKPDAFLRLKASELGIHCARRYAVGLVFISPFDGESEVSQAIITEKITAQGLEVAVGEKCRSIHRPAAKKR